MRDKEFYENDWPDRLTKKECRMVIIPLFIVGIILAVVWAMPK